MSINEYQALIKAAKAGGILLPLETSSASTTTYQSQQPSSSSSSSSSILPNLDDVKRNLCIHLLMIMLMIARLLLILPIFFHYRANLL